MSEELSDSYIAGLFREVQRSGCAVEIGGVRMHPCDTRGNEIKTAHIRAHAESAECDASCRGFPHVPRVSSEGSTHEGESGQRGEAVGPFAVGEDADLGGAGGAA